MAFLMAQSCGAGFGGWARFDGMRVIWPLTLLLCALLLPVRALAADPLPYTVKLTPYGDAALDQALRDSSSLIGLHDSVAVGPFALVSRARDDALRLMQVLESFGHYAGRLRIEIAGRALIQAEPGPVFSLRQVTLTGDVPAEAREVLKLKAGDPAVASAVLAAQGRMLATLQASGHALATVSAPVATLDAPARALDVSYRVVAGPRVDIGPVSVTGLQRVDPGFVARRLLVQDGEPYDPAKIERARQDLASLGVFGTVRARAAERLGLDRRLPLAFEVTERARHAVSATAAYSTDLGASLGLTFQHRNLFGAAEQLNLGVAVTQVGGSASTGLGYNATAALTKPDFLARGQSVTGSVQAIKESLEAYNRTALLAGVTLARRLGPLWTVSAGLQAEEARITQEGAMRSYTLLGVPLAVRYDSTGAEGLFEPVHGIKAGIVVTPTASVTSPGSIFTIVQANASTYFDLGAPGRSVLAVRGLLGSVQGATTFQLPPDQRFYAGGGGTVRGYKYQSIGPRFRSTRPTGGISVAAATVEFRQRFGESYGAAVFLDAGQVGAGAMPLQGGVRAAVGVGARYYTSIGPIRVDVALPLNAQHGDDAFELYIGIGQAF